MDVCDQCHDVIERRTPVVYLPKTQRTYCGSCYDQLRAKMFGYMLHQMQMEPLPAKRLLDTLPRAVPA